MSADNPKQKLLKQRNGLLDGESLKWKPSKSPTP